MGADMILAICPSPENLGITDEQAISLLVRWAATMDREQAERYFEEGGGESLEEAYEERDTTGVEDLAASHEEDPALAWARDFVRDDLIDCFRTVNNSRAVARLQLGGRIWLLSGGMSWGDPTEHFCELAKLASTEVFENPAVRSCLDLSTAHIPEPVMNRGSSGVNQNVLSVHFNHRVESHGHGWIVFLGDRGMDAGAEEWCQSILRVARASGCFLINFDADGPIVPFLESFHGGAMEQLANTHEENER